MRTCVDCGLNRKQKGRLRCKTCAIIYKERLSQLSEATFKCSGCDKLRIGRAFLKANSIELHEICLNCRKSDYLKSHPEVKKKSVDRARWLRNSTPERQERSRKYQRDNHDKEKASKYWKSKGHLNGKASYRRLMEDPSRRSKKNEYNSEYNKRTGNSRVTNAKWRASILRRTPAWANKSTIKDIYRNCPADMTVDHVVPLQGLIVCGLHVENNLAYLSKSINSRKGSLLLFITQEDIDRIMENDYQEEVVKLLGYTDGATTSDRT